MFESDCKPVWSTDNPGATMMFFRRPARLDTPLHPTIQREGIKTVGDLVQMSTQMADDMARESAEARNQINALRQKAVETDEKMDSMRQSMDALSCQVEALTAGYSILFRTANDAIDQLLNIAEGMANVEDRNKVAQVAQSLVKAMQEGRKISLRSGDAANQN